MVIHEIITPNKIGFEPPVKRAIGAKGDEPRPSTDAPTRSKQAGLSMHGTPRQYSKHTTQYAGGVELSMAVDV